MSMIKMETKHQNDCPFCKAGFPLHRKYEIAEVNGNSIPTGRIISLSGKVYDEIINATKKGQSEVWLRK